MTVNGSEPGPSPPGSHPRTPRYCAHESAREIRMYMPYGEANAVRLRLMLSGEARWRHVSVLYEIPNGWAWTLCNQCPAEARREAVGE